MTTSRSVAGVPVGPERPGWRPVLFALVAGLLAAPAGASCQDLPRLEVSVGVAPRPLLIRSGLVLQAAVDAAARRQSWRWVFGLHTADPEHRHDHSCRNDRPLSAESSVSHPGPAGRPPPRPDSPHGLEHRRRSRPVSRGHCRPCGPADCGGRALLADISSPTARIESPDEVNRRFMERADRYREVPGLKQKYYVKFTETGEYGGIYWFSTTADRIPSAEEVAQVVMLPKTPCPRPRR